jgi:hypothetical protein
MSNVTPSDGGTGASEGEVQAAEKEAASYAWDYFQYHAGQRLSVFRFYLTIVAAVTISYGYAQRQTASLPPPAIVVTQGAQQELKSSPIPSQPLSSALSSQAELFVGMVYLVTSFLFWRLDERNRILIGFSEEALKRSERRLADILKSDTICLMSHGERKNASNVFRPFERFKQIHRWIFFLVGLAGIYLICHHFGIVGGL